MKNEEDQLNDAFLQDLFRNSPLDSPGGDFVSTVMAGIQPIPAAVPVKKPFFQQILSWWPYGLAAAFVVLVFTTSDLPFGRFIPGRAYVTDTLVPHVLSFFAGIMNLFGRFGSVSIFLVVLSAGLFLFLLDRYLFKRFSTIHLFSF